jgi:hypothetical protein
VAACMVGGERTTPTTTAADRGSFRPGRARYFVEASTTSSSERRGRDWFTWRALACCAPILLAGAVLLAVRLRLPFRLPVPWPDETWFIVPAYAFARTGSFFDPGLNPDRVVMWMPPGYMVVLAAAFRIFGYGFGVARGVSTTCALVSLALVSRLAWRFTIGWWRVAAALAIAAAFISPNMLVSANVARMEALFCCAIIVSLSFAVAGRLYVAGAIVAAASVIHFNAVYFILPIVLPLGAALLTLRLGWPKRWDWLAMAAAAAVLGLYGLHVTANWPGFLADMQVQFAGKLNQPPRGPARALWHFAAALGLTALAFWQRRRLDGPVLAALYGCSFVAMTDNGGECWYDYGQPLGAALVSMALLAEGGRGMRWQAAALGLALTAGTAVTISESIIWLLPQAPSLRRDLIPKAELAKVRTLIAGLHPGDTVNFGSAGIEPFFLADFERVGAHWTMFAHSATSFFPARKATWLVRCDSADFSQHAILFDIAHRRSGHDTGCAIFPWDLK